MTWHPQSVPCADDAAWHKLRATNVTASQIAALVGIHPYLTVYELWATKSGRLPAEVPDNAALRRGRMLEQVAVDLIREHWRPQRARVEHNAGINRRFWYDEATRIGGTPDVLVYPFPSIEGEKAGIDEPGDPGLGVIQIKTVEPGTFARTWRLDGEIEPPLWIILQAIAEAKLVGASWAQVAVLRVGFGLDFDLVDVPLHEAAWIRLVTAVENFWHLVDTSTPPPVDYGRDGRLLASLYPADDGTTIDLTGDNELIDALIARAEIKSRQRQLEADCSRHDALIRAKAGDAQVVLVGPYKVTLKTTRVAAHTVDAYTYRQIRIAGMGKRP
jgi:hypothetical protein